MISNEAWQASQQRRDERTQSEMAAELELARRHTLFSISALDCADLACDDEFARLMARDDVTPNEIGRWILSARNAWAQRVAERILGGGL